MLSSKLQKDLMDAYQKVYEEKRGHAAGSDDTEKQASQLASDVRYKAKSKVPDGASKEEKIKIFLQILNASPAPNVVKAMAKQKLLGEEVVHEMRFDDGPEGTKKRKKALEKKRGMKLDNHPQFKEVKEGLGQMGGDIIKKSTNILKKGKERLGKFVPKKGSTLDRQVNPPKDDLPKGVKEETAPRKQKGAMAYDGPNKPASEAKDRLLAKAKKKREKMSESLNKSIEEVSKTLKGSTKKVQKQTKRMDTGGDGTAYRGESVKPVGNIFNEKKMDPVGQEDKDIDNDGDHDSTDKYLLKRRKAIGKAIAKKRGRVKEGFSAWRIDLDFNEQVKK